MAESALPRAGHPLDLCECRHDRQEHDGKCKGLDSYDCPCACPGFELWIKWD